MNILLLILASAAIYCFGKDIFEETKEIFSELKPKKKSKCKCYLFPIWKTKNYRRAQND